MQLVHKKLILYFVSIVSFSTLPIEPPTILRDENLIMFEDVSCIKDLPINKRSVNKNRRRRKKKSTKKQRHDKTDKIIPRTPAELVGKVYQLLRLTDHILTYNGITYWASGGTVLGAIRHGGQIPWDDDADIEIFQHDLEKLISLKEQFIQHGLELIIRPNNIHKVYFTGSRYPFLDIFTTSKKDCSHKITLLNKHWPHNYWYESELFPIQRIPFGPITVCMAHSPLRYLETLYGKNYMHSVIFWNHIKLSESKEKIKLKTTLKLVDRKPAPYIYHKPTLHYSKLSEKTTNSHPSNHQNTNQT